MGKRSEIRDCQPPRRNESSWRRRARTTGKKQVSLCLVFLSSKRRHGFCILELRPAGEGFFTFRWLREEYLQMVGTVLRVEETVATFSCSRRRCTRMCASATTSRCSVSLLKKRGTNSMRTWSRRNWYALLLKEPGLL